MSFTSARPWTCTGVVGPLVVPWPSCPLSLLPHAQAVPSSRGDGFRVGDTLDADRGGAESRGAIALLADQVSAPRPHGAVVFQGNRVIGACGDGLGIRDVDDSLGSAVTTGGSVAELPVVVISPCSHLSLA